MIEKGATHWNYLVKFSFDLQMQLKMFNNIDFPNKHEMLTNSIILRNYLKLYTLIILNFQRIPLDLFLIIIKLIK